MKHGTYSGYVHHGCRCEACKYARYRYAKAHRTGTALPGRIDATGTRRRLQALAVIGWPNHDLGARLGLTPQGIHAITRRTWVSVTTHARVVALYDELHMTPGPSVKVRQMARAKAWAPPLAWDAIDDPAETPNLGAPSLSYQRIHVDDVLWVLRYERHTWASLADRFDVPRATLYGALRRAGEQQWIDRLTEAAA